MPTFAAFLGHSWKHGDAIGPSRTAMNFVLDEALQKHRNVGDTDDPVRIDYYNLVASRIRIRDGAS
jgi:hypothetical protein